MTLNDKDRECIEEIAEKEIRKAVTWPVLIPIILVIIGLFAGGVWALHGSAKAELQKQIDDRPTHKEFAATFEAIQGNLIDIRGELKTLNDLHPRRGEK